MLPVADHVPLAGSYSSAEVSSDSPPLPPTKSTWPSRSCTAACPGRGVPIDPVRIQTPPGPATGTGLADGAADSLGLGNVASGDAVATAITEGSGTGGTTVGRRRRP